MKIRSIDLVKATGPKTVESLALAAQRMGRDIVQTYSAFERSESGQFFTPLKIASTMAQRACARLTKEHISVLDPAAGSGILAAAAIDELLAREEPPFAISIMLCERDPRLHPALLRLAGKMRKAAGRRAVKINISIQIGDFLLSKIALERTQLFDRVCEFLGARLQFLE